MFKFNLFSIAAILLVVTSVFAQVEHKLQFTDEELRNELHWIELMQQENPNFFEVKRAYDLYFENHEKVKGSGWKQFERWAWLVEGDVRPDGSLPAPDAVFNAYQVYKYEQQLKGPGTNPGNWTEIGPMTYPVNNTGQETGTGRVNALAFHPTNPNKFWVGAPSGGLWVTEDGGTTYTSNTDQMPTLGVSSIIVDPVSPDILYLGSGDRDAGNAPGLGVFKSTDGGATWILSNTGMGSLTVGMMIMYPGNTSIIIAATSGGIYRTSDAGANWTQVSSNSSNYKDIIFHPTDPAVVYATASGDFYRSADAGLSWTQVSSGLISCSRMVLGVSADEPDAAFCLLTGGSQTFQGIFKSVDKGQNFTRITSSSHPNILGYTDGDDKSQATYDLCMLVNPNDADMILVGSICIHRSDNGGVTFTKKAHWSTQVHADQHTVARNPLNGRIYEGHDGGLHFSDDYFETWTNISSGLNIAQAYKIGQAAQTRELVVNGYQDNGTGIFDAGTFTTITGGDGMECLIDYDDEKYVYATYISDIKRSTSGGYGNWGSIAKNGLHGIDESGAWITPYMLHESDPNTMFFGYKNIWRSNNVRNNPPVWTKISDNLGGSNSSNYRALAQSLADNNVFYGARDDNNFFRSDNVNDATPIWTDLSSKLPLGSGYIADVTCHATDLETVYLIQSDKVFKSMDKGNSWTDISGSLPAVSLKCIVYDKYSNEGIYIGTKTGVFFKDASMSDWILFDGGLPVVDVRELEIYYGSTDSRLRAATYGRGLWETSLYNDPSATPVANFKANKTTVNVGETIILEDLSAYAPTSWTWTITPASFTYANSTNANSQHPQIIINATGVYNVSLQVSNANGSDTKTINSYISAYGVVTPSCTPATQNLGSFGMGIYHVQLNTIDNNSGLPIEDNPVDGYMDFISSDNTILNPGTSYDLTVELGTGYSEYWNVYIDYNNDGDFLDTDEEVYVAPEKVTGEQIISITIPASPIFDQLLRMRVLCDYGNITGPCYNPSYGQAEDYGVVIKDLPQLTTVVVSNIGNDAGQSGGNITSQGGSAISSRGVVWGFYTNPTLDNNWGYTEDGTGTGSYVSQMNGLKANQNYFVRAYAINDGGIAYGQNETFTTLSEDPVLATDDITNILYFTATGGGNITDDGGQTIQSRGVVWDTVSSPTYSRNVGKTSDGTGTGSFTSNIVELFPDITYYVRAYARNNYSVAYGQEKTFNTLPPDANQASNIHFENITTDKMDILWTNGTGSKRVVKINSTNSFIPPADGADPVANTVYGGGEQVIYNDVGSTVTVTNLDPFTIYYFIIYDYIGTGAGTVFNTAPGIDNPNFGSTYCLPSYSNSNIGTYIKRFVCNTIDNTSGNTHYSDFSNISTDLLPGNTYDVSFEMSYNPQNLSLWIDWDDNQEFEASEKLLSDLSCPKDVTTTGQITLPSTTDYGQHLMRVRASWGTGAGPCSTESYGEVEDYTVDFISDATWTGTVSTNWDASGNWNINNIPDAGAKVTIPSGATYYPALVNDVTCKDLTISLNASVTINPEKALTVTGDLINNGGNSGLVIKSDATGSGSLINNSDNVDATVERYISEWTDDVKGWHLIASPVNTFTINGSDFDPGTEDDMYGWNEASDLWMNHKAGDPTQVITGIGYLTAWKTTDIKNFTGTVNNSDVTFNNLSYTTTNGYTGWHLLGNPYPCALKWDATSWATNNVDGTAKIWNETNASYTDIAQNGIIPSTQGFMVNVSSATNSITIPLADRTHSLINWYKTTEENKFMLTVHDTELQTAQESVIAFNDNATVGFDSKYDSWFLVGYAPQFYSVIAEGNVSTNTLPEVSNTTTIPMSFIKNSSATYYIEATGVNNIVLQENVYLTDLKTSHTQLLNDNPVYEFTSEEGDVNERFVVHFSTLDIDEIPLNENIEVYSSGNNVEIRSVVQVDCSIRVYDISGRLITVRKLNNENSATINIPNYKGVVIVSVVSQKHNYTEKVIIW